MVQMEEQPEPFEKACSSRTGAKQASPPGLRELCPREKVQRRKESAPPPPPPGRDSLRAESGLGR